MKNALLIIFLFVLSITAFAGNNKIDKATEAKVKAMASNKQLEFIENKGQIVTTEGKPADNVLFKASIGGCDIYVTDKGLSYVFIKFEEKEGEANDDKDKARTLHPTREDGNKEEKEIDLNSTKSHKSGSSPFRRGGGEVKEEDENKKVSYYRLDMDLVGATITKENIIKEEESQQGHYNYFYPHCPEGIYNVKAYGKITIKDIYKGIDWVIYTNKNNKEQPIKYDFVVHPNADYNDIKLKYINADSLSLCDNDTKLKIKTIAATIEEGSIYTYQNNTEKKEIKSNYVMNNDSTISFAVADYDKTQTLIIDPLVWATYYGGSGDDLFYSMCVDHQDNVYITGQSQSLNFPTLQLTGAYWQTINSYFFNLVILKFNVQNVRLWATFYNGATNSAIPKSSCVDSQNNLYIVGQGAGPNFPCQQLAGAYYQPISLGNQDGFILKFNSLGIRQWATLFGGTQYDCFRSVCVDSLDNILIAGLTMSSDFPIMQLAGAYWQPWNLGYANCVIVKFNNQGVLVWSTYYGGSNYDYAYSICIDNHQNFYVIGSTRSTDFPTQQLTGAYWQPSFAGGLSDGFILKYSNQGVRLWCTYYGGSNKDFEPTSTYSSCDHICCIDSQDNLYITGNTQSTDLPTQQLSGAYWQNPSSSLYGIYILKFNSQGVRLWATYYAIGEATSICVDNFDNIYLTGKSGGVNFPIQQLAGEYWQPIVGGDFILKFNDLGVRKWATYYGYANISSYQYSANIAKNSQNNIYIIGYALGSGNYIVNPGNGAYFSNYNDSTDGIILKIAPCDAHRPTSLQSNRNNICANDNGTITLTAIGGVGDTLRWFSGGCGQNYIGKNTPITISAPTQTTTYYARWEKYCDTSTCDSIVIYVVPSTSINQNLLICTGQSVHVGTHIYTTAGVYSDTLTSVNGCDSVVKTILTITQIPVINLGNDTTLCTGQTLTLKANIPNVTYLWQDNTTDSIYNINQQGTYWVRVSVNSNCFTSDTIHVIYKPNPIVNLGNDTMLCNGETITLTAANSNCTYLWQNNSTNSSYKVIQQGVYWVVVSNQYNCKSYDTIIVTYNPIPIINIGKDTSLCNGQTIQLNAQYTNAIYHWQDGSTQANYTATQTGTYWVKVTDTTTKCSSVATIKLNCDLEPVIPNIITPNGDGYNDYFVIQNIAYWNINIQVFNRWGVKVYEDNNYQNNWNGKDLAEGVYYYIIKATNQDNGIVNNYKGSVTILR